MSSHKHPKWLSKALSVALSITIFISIGIYMHNHLRCAALAALVF